MDKITSSSFSYGDEDYDVLKAAKLYMRTITDRIFRDNIFDYRNCKGCPDNDCCEEKRDMKEIYNNFMKEMKPYAEMVAVSLAHAEFCRRREKRKGAISDTGGFTY